MKALWFILRVEHIIKKIRLGKIIKSMIGLCLLAGVLFLLHFTIPQYDVMFLPIFTVGTSWSICYILFDIISYKYKFILFFFITLAIFSFNHWVRQHPLISVFYTSFLTGFFLYDIFKYFFSKNQ